MRRHVVAVLLSAAVWAACRPAERVYGEGSGPRERAVVDGLGRKVMSSRPARRIASLSPSNTEIAAALGCGGFLVLRDRASDFPPAIRDLPQTDPFRLSVEHVAGFAPDLVLASHLDANRVAALEAVGLRVAVFDPRTVAEVFRDIVNVGRLCGRTKAALRLAGHLRAQLAALAQQIKGRARPAVYVELDGSDPARPWAVGGRSLVADVLRLAGGRNIFADLPRGAAQVSAEAVLRRAPQVILLDITGVDERQARGALRMRPGWQGIPAIRRDRVLTSIDPALLTRPGPRIVEGVAALARALHPEAFAAATYGR